MGLVFKAVARGIRAIEPPWMGLRRALKISPNSCLGDDCGTVCLQYLSFVLKKKIILQGQSEFFY